MLKKRPIAILIAVAVISLSTIFSAHRTLGAKSQEVSDSFYSGVYDSEWNTNRKSISSQLVKRDEASNALLSVASDYKEAADATLELRESRNAFLRSNGRHETFKNNEELTKSFDRLISQMNSLELSSREEDIVEDSITSFRGAQNVINNAGYNELVREFERNTLNVFPANVLKTVAFVKTPELFE